MKDTVGVFSENLLTTLYSPSLVVLAGDNASSPDSSGSPGGDETDLSSGGRVPLDGRRLSDMLMVSSSVGMLDGVHTHTAHLRPAVPLGLVLEVCTARLQDRLLDPSTAGDDSNH